MLPKKNRLRSADFKKMRGGKIAHSSHFFARIIRAADFRETKAAAAVSYAVARSAVARNLLRRRIYAVIETPGLGAGFWVAVTAKKSAAELSFAELNEELCGLLRNLTAI